MWLSPRKYRIFLAASILVLVGTFFLHLFRLIPTRDAMVVLAIVVLLDFLPPYFLVPIRFRRNLWLGAALDFEPFNPAREVVPEEFWDQIHESVGCLRPAGFKVVGHFRKSGFVPGFIGFTTLMENCDHATVVKAMSTFMTNGKGGTGRTTLAFFTELTDGTEIVTANNSILPGTPHSRAKKRISLWMPEVRFPSDLYEYHERLVERFAVIPKRDILNGNPADYMKTYSESELAHWIKEGYYKLDVAGERYRLTWKGAILTAWKQLWPIKPIRRAWRKHQTNKLLRKLEE